jgi:hypothetical protein
MFKSDALDERRPITVNAVPYYFQSLTLTMLTFIIDEICQCANMREAGNNEYHNKMNEFNNPSSLRRLHTQIYIIS